jgi:acyl carrier protein
MNKTLPFDRFAYALLKTLAIDVPSALSRETGLFDDLGLSSIQAFEMIIVIEEAAELLIPMMDLPRIFTLGDAYDYYLAAVVEAAEQS